MLEAFNEHCEEGYTPSWLNCLDESMNSWLNKFCPGFMICPRKPWPFGNEYHSIADGDENGHNPINNRIFPNDAAVSDTNGNLEFHTTGFKFYGGAENLSNVYAYYVAFADQPKAFANAGLKNI